MDDFRLINKFCTYSDIYGRFIKPFKNNGIDSVQIWNLILSNLTLLQFNCYSNQYGILLNSQLKVVKTCRACFGSIFTIRGRLERNRTPNVKTKLHESPHSC